MKSVVVFRIDRRSGVATYLQIVRQVEQALRMGALEEGDRLPTAAQVAASTKVNPNTTLKAYRELERMGLAEVRQGAGTFITRSLAQPQSGPGSPLRSALAEWLDRAPPEGPTRPVHTHQINPALVNTNPPEDPHTT
ncbi:GntR family transcriptional regulator, partial [Streptomyces anulatus]